MLRHELVKTKRLWATRNDGRSVRDPDSQQTFPRIVSQLPRADFGGRIGLKLHGVVKSVLKMIVEWNVQS